MNLFLIGVLKTGELNGQHMSVRIGRDENMKMAIYFRLVSRQLGIVLLD
jgi:hypothetical protein